jgi:hypothetical protein
MPSIRWGTDTGAEVCVPFVGYSALSGCRYTGAGGADDGVALGWNEHVVDANTVGLWRMNEAAWNGTAGEVLDYSGNGNHGQSFNGVDTEAGWMGRSANFLLGVNAYVNLMNVGSNSYTVEGWFNLDPTMPSYGYLYDADLQMRCYNMSSSNKLRFTSFGVYYDIARPAWNTWFHLRHTATRGTQAQVFLNGVSQGTWVPGTWGPASRVFRLASRNGTNDFAKCRIDDVKYSTVSQFSSDFTVARYKSAAQNGSVQPYAQCSQAGLTGMVPAEVSWSATVGDLYGQVKRVLVNDVSAGWTAVGGDYPTSPVSVSGLVLASADAVRVELEPKADALQSETPVLDWLHLEYLLPSGGRVYRPTPMRLGPKLIPIGVF